MQAAVQYQARLYLLVILIEFSAPVADALEVVENLH